MGRSKPTTSQKASQKFGLSVEQAASLKQELSNGANLSQQHLLNILRADQTCDSACKGRKDNPNCLCGLVPAPGSFRRKGLWQKEPQGLQQIGADPNDLKKQVLQAAFIAESRVLTCTSHEGVKTAADLQS